MSKTGGSCLAVKLRHDYAFGSRAYLRAAIIVFGAKRTLSAPTKNKLVNMCIKLGSREAYLLKHTKIS